MFKIVNGASLVMEMDPDQVITVERINPLLNDSDVFMQDLSYPGIAPLTENNKLFFGMANLVETPNDEYNIPATCYAEEVPMSVGNINFQVKKNGFDFNLEPNYTAKNALIKNIRLPEIFTNDSDMTLTTAAAFTARMLDTVKFPEKYPYVFVPIKNPGIDTAFTPAYGFINPFNDTTQTFETGAGAAWVPFYKLTYILRIVLEYLGYQVGGTFFSDPETAKLLIYSRMACTNRIILPSMMYMPNMLVSDFLKFCRNRYHLAIDMDNATGVATVSSFAQVKKLTKAVDLTAYMVEGTEQEVPTDQGYSVTLKSDESDSALKDEDGTIRPLLKLVAGNGSNEVELDLSTLKGTDESAGGNIGKRYCEVDQALSGVNFFGDDFYPADLNNTDLSDPSAVNNWPLRVFRYEGWTALTAGGHFPNSSPNDLNDDDAAYYRFLNDSKRLIKPGMFPPSVISSLNNTGVYCYRTTQRNYIYFLLEKVAYDFKSSDMMVSTKLYLRTFEVSVKTKVTISPLLTTVNDTDYTTFIKAYWDNSPTGFEELTVEVGFAASPTPYGSWTFKTPTNSKGAGGVAFPFKSSEADNSVRRIIIRQGNPKFLQRLGKRFPFVWSDANKYWYVDISRQLPVVSYSFFYWISF